MNVVLQKNNFLAAASIQWYNADTSGLGCNFAGVFLAFALLGCDGFGTCFGSGTSFCNCSSISCIDFMAWALIFKAAWFLSLFHWMNSVEFGDGIGHCTCFSVVWASSSDSWVTCRENFTVRIIDIFLSTSLPFFAKESILERLNWKLSLTTWSNESLAMLCTVVVFACLLFGRPQRRL